MHVCNSNHAPPAKKQSSKPQGYQRFDDNGLTITKYFSLRTYSPRMESLSRAAWAVHSVTSTPLACCVLSRMLIPQNVLSGDQTTWSLLIQTPKIKNGQLSILLVIIIMHLTHVMYDSPESVKVRCSSPICMKEVISTASTCFLFGFLLTRS